MGVAETSGEAEKILTEIIDRLTLNNESLSLTPRKVASILLEADQGRNHRQSKLAEEILEKDPDISAAISTRQNALTALDWGILPASGENVRDEVSETVEEVLRGIEGNMDQGLISFDQLLSAMASSFLPGFDCSMIDFKPGGGDINGFLHLPQHNFTFFESAFIPKLRTKAHRENGIPLPGGTKNWVIHRHFQDARDITRSGLIRPLAWLFVFKNFNTKDLLRFREKYGIPFLLGKMDGIVDGKGALTKEGRALKKLLTNFGSDGVALLSDAVTMEMIEPSNMGADIFFKSDELFAKEIAKVVLGQTSTQDAEGSNRSTAQVHDGVRHTILAADCKSVSLTVSQQLIRQITNNKFGPNTPCPRHKFKCELPPDSATNSATIKTMDEAGWEPGNEQFLNDQVGNANWKRKSTQGDSDV